MYFFPSYNAKEAKTPTQNSGNNTYKTNGIETVPPSGTMNGKSSKNGRKTVAKYNMSATFNPSSIIEKIAKLIENLRSIFT
jgi:hypothetical protein